MKCFFLGNSVKNVLHLDEKLTIVSRRKKYLLPLNYTPSQPPCCLFATCHVTIYTVMKSKLD